MEVLSTVVVSVAIGSVVAGSTYSLARGSVTDLLTGTTGILMGPTGIRTGTAGILTGTTGILTGIKASTSAAASPVMGRDAAMEVAAFRFLETVN